MKKFFAILIISTPSVLAHHGQDFLLNYDPTVPGVGRAISYSSFEWSKDGGTNEIAIEPGALVGVAPNVAIGTTVRIADEGSGSWGYSGVNPMLQIILPSMSDKWQFGLFAGYLFADGETHSHDDSHSYDPNPGGIDLGPDAPPPGPIVHDHGDGGHSHTGIHRHGEDHFQLRFLFQTRVNENVRIIGNLIGIAAGGGDYAFGYSLGIRQQFNHAWAAGLETIGDFNSNGDHEILAGTYWTPIDACTLRLGIGTGIGSSSKDLAIHSGVTWRF